MKNVYILTGAKCNYEVFSDYDTALTFAKKMAYYCTPTACVIFFREGKKEATKVFCDVGPTDYIIPVIQMRERPVI